MLSSCCSDLTSVLLLAVASFQVSVLLTGVIWPLEGMPPYLRIISSFLPQTNANEALRSVFGRGWGIDEPDVYIGLASTYVWILSFILLTILIIRIKK